MTFWNWRRGTGAAATSGSAAMALTTELAPIELYTADARIVGWIAASGRRVTDLLNQEGELRLWQPSPGPIEAPAAENGETGLSGAVTMSAAPEDPDGSGEWQTLVTDDIILAMPPEWRASRQLRLHRKLRRVVLAAGPFHVTGTLHLPPGAEAGPDYLLRSPRFLPLTDTYILHQGDPPFEHVVSVAIVNGQHISRLVPLVSLA